MDIAKPATLDLLDTSGAPALSSTSDMPVVETKPDATPAASEPAAPSSEPETKEQEAAGEDTTKSESATDPDELSASDEPKKAKGVQKRLDELVKQREQAEARAEAERQEKLRLLALLEEGRKKPEPESVETTPIRPNRDDFETPDQWEEALIAHSAELARWTAKQEIERERTEQAEQARQREIAANSERAQAVFAERTAKFSADKPDFQEVAFRADVEVSMQMAAAIIESEAGPALQYYLGQNPAEAARIMQLSPQRQFVEMGKLEAKLSAPAPTPAPVSRAPAPIRPTVPSADTSIVDPENESVEAYAARRRRELGVGDPMGRVRH